jgi:hypothetical protein
VGQGLAWPEPLKTRVRQRRAAHGQGTVATLICTVGGTQLARSVLLHRGVRGSARVRLSALRQHTRWSGAALHRDGGDAGFGGCVANRTPRVASMPPRVRARSWLLAAPGASA